MNNDLRTLVRGAYAVQKLRIQMGNRIVGNWKAKLGQAPGEPEEEMGAEGQALLAQIRASYKKIMDGYKDFPPHKKFVGDAVISTYTEICLVAQYVSLEKQESEHFKRLGAILRDYPIYTKFLEGVKGVGPAMAGVIISEFDITKAKYPSSLWAYAGLDVADDGRGRSRKAEHLVERDYVNKDGEPAKRMGITFNPFLKTKLTGVLAASFLRAGDNPYSRIYRDYKNRLENHPAHAEKTKGHRHNMALRFMIKSFLIDLYKAWRTLEGLEVAPSYQEAKLRHVHGEAA